MRILPIALWYAQAPASELIAAARRASTLTHRHERSQWACAFYCLIVRALLLGQESAAALPSTLAEIAGTPGGEAYAALQAGGLAQWPEDRVSSSGYVVHTLEASLWCLLTTSSFSAAVLRAVNLGDDTDTTGTVTGGLAGALYGEAAIPPTWRSALARHDDVATLFDRFLARL